MKIFHTADWHLGKTIYNVPMTKADQPHWIEELLRAVDREQPAVTIIAGDVYDRRTPSVEAVRLLDYFLAEMAKRDKYVLIVPGNHDSETRLSFGAEIFTSKKIFIASELSRELKSVTVREGGDEVVFWLLPYVYPGLANKVFDEHYDGFDAAVRGVLSAQTLDKTKCNVLIAHQNVLNNGVQPEHSNSETFIGGSGEVEVSAFADFDYVALGHIHNRQKIGRETVRYAGCPLYYDFSEAERNRVEQGKAVTVSKARDKAVTVIETKGKEVAVDELKLPLLHTMKVMEGTLGELLAQGEGLADKDKTYFQMVLTDHGVPTDAGEQLRAVYGEDNILNIKQAFLERNFLTPSEERPERNLREESLPEQFADFYLKAKGDPIDEVQYDILQKISEQQENRGEYYSAGTEVTEEENRELAEMIMRKVAEKQK